MPVGGKRHERLLLESVKPQFFGAARRSHLRAVALPPLLLTAFLVALLACGPADVAPEAEPGGLTLAPQESGDTSTPEPEPTASPTPEFNQFINDCYMTWFNMFLSPTDNLEDNIWCYNQQLNHYSKWLSELPPAPSLESVQEAWLAVQETVEQDPDVAAAYAKVISCLNDIEGLTVDEELLFPWQDFISAADYEAKMRGLTGAQRTSQVQLYVPTETCAAGDSAYYYIQTLAWRAEVARLKANDPTVVQPLVDAYLIDTLERPGRSPYDFTIPHWLTLAGGRVFRDGAGPNPTPIPTAFPASARARTTTESRRVTVPHPDGVEGCKNIGLFYSPLETRLYGSWCSHETIKDMRSQCTGIGTSEEELACSEAYFADWKNGFSKFVTVCLVYTDQGTGYSCLEEKDLGANFLALGEVWEATRLVVARQPAVTAAHAKVVQCLAGKHFPGVPDDFYYSWQHEPFVEAPTWYSGLTDAEKVLLSAVVEPMNECAENSGIYEAQDAAWLAEAQRLVAAEPTRAQPFIDWGILASLEEEGPAPFLFYNP